MNEIELESRVYELLETGRQRIDDGTWLKGSQGNLVNSFCSVSSMWQRGQHYMDMQDQEGLRVYQRAINHLYSSLPADRPNYYEAEARSRVEADPRMQESEVVLWNDSHLGAQSKTEALMNFDRALARSEAAIKALCPTPEQEQVARVEPEHKFLGSFTEVLSDVGRETDRLMQLLKT